MNSGVLYFWSLDLVPPASVHVLFFLMIPPPPRSTLFPYPTPFPSNDGNPSVGPVPIMVNCAVVTITKTADQVTVSAGDTIGYLDTVTNTGPCIAGNVTVSDTLPTNSGLSCTIAIAGSTPGWPITAR